MISRFFIDRPIFAAVLSIVITLAGGLSVVNLPLAMYPTIAPPTVTVDCRFPGASAKDVSEAVASPIEQQVNGVEGMLYMSSQCTNDGAYNLTVTFQQGVNLNMAQVLVQNRVALALPLLPDVIKQAGVTARKRSPDILMAIAINSPDNSRDNLYLSNYALLRVREELSRLPGVSDVNMMGQQDYSMRIWLDPEQLAARGLATLDVIRAVREQNRPVAAGQIGQPPVADGQPLQITVDVLGRLRTPEQFGAIVVKADGDGRVVRLRDVARVTVGAKSLDVATKVNGRPSVTMAVFQLPDANALETADAVKARIAELQKDFPDGVGYEIRYDTTPFIRESIEEVVRTLREAVVLVALVVLLFLQNWRSAIIPLIAVPVAIVGTFAVMMVMGFSINNLTLFGLVLAIGIVVDDAIVVVEAVEHHMEHGLAPRAATIRAMEEVSGPVVAIGLVLTAVFVPCAFISGIVGQFFRQFALTIAASTIISTVNSLTLSPALAAVMLKPAGPGGRRADPLPAWGIALLGAWLGHEWLAPMAEEHLAHRLATLGPEAIGWASAVVAAIAGLIVGRLVARPINALISVLFRAFNAGFKRLTGGYILGVRGLLRISLLVLAAYGGLLYLTKAGFESTPKGFIPSQDMGYMLLNVQLPDSASLERTQATMDKIEDIAKTTKGVKFTQTTTGMSMLLSATGSNFGSSFVILEPFHDRPDPFPNRVMRWLNGPKTDPKVDLAVRWLNNPRPPKPDDPTHLSALGLGEGWLRNDVMQPLKDWTFRRIASVSPSLERSLQDKFDALYRPSLNSELVANTLRARFEAEVPEAMITVLPPPPVRGVGRAGGFKLLVEDRGDVIGLQGLQKQTEILNNWAKGTIDPEVGKTDPEFAAFLKDIAVDPATGDPRLAGMTSVFRANVPQLYIDIDRKECLSKQVNPRDLFSTLQVYLGSLYINDFNLYGRTWQVVAQASPDFRDDIQDIVGLKVRNAEGTMVPVGALAEVRKINGPLIVTRYNMYTAAPLNGSAALGVSSGEAIQIMEDLSRDVLPESMRIEWTELAYLELQAGNTAMMIFGFAVIMVFLVLAAQYESWALPLAVILVVPLCLLCSIAGVKVANEDINIFTQIGFVVLVGLACKNAILIVEFARAERMAGRTAREAALAACRLRLRPIVMTSMAFVLGVFPLLTGQGAGSEMRRTLGTAVFFGMLGVTIFGLLLTPVFFVMIDRLGETALFRSRAARAIGRILLGVFALGYAKSLARRAWNSRPRRRRPTIAAVPVPVAANGQDHGNGNGQNHTNGQGNGNGHPHDPADDTQQSALSTKH